MLYDFLQIILHLDIHLAEWMNHYGSGIYAILFLIIFCETGLVVTPFLPGDSLLFALGALCAMTDGNLSLSVLSVLLVLAAFCGDNVNYFFGSTLGAKLATGPERVWLKKSHLKMTEEFMHKYGKVAVILARFAPLLRTFVPFVAGIARMNKKVFLSYSLIGAVVWTQSLLWLGYLFGQTPFVKKNFSMLVLAVIGISLIPALVTVLKARRRRRHANLD